ncbi:hypothetical protein Tco_0931987 [Tanacetum coccineum]
MRLQDHLNGLGLDLRLDLLDYIVTRFVTRAGISDGFGLMRLLAIVVVVYGLLSWLRIRWPKEMRVRLIELAANPMRLVNIDVYLVKLDNCVSG